MPVVVLLQTSMHCLFVQDSRSKEGTLVFNLLPLRVVAPALAAGLKEDQLPIQPEPPNAISIRHARKIRNAVLPRLSKECFVFDDSNTSMGRRLRRGGDEAPAPEMDPHVGCPTLNVCYTANTAGLRKKVLKAFRDCGVSDEDTEAFNRSKKQLVYYWYGKLQSLQIDRSQKPLARDAAAI